jgi:hypothetical protein
MATRELFVKTRVLTILYYGDVVWGDKHNQILMQKIQVIQNTAAKVILDKLEDHVSEMTYTSSHLHVQVYKRSNLYGDS